MAETLWLLVGLKAVASSSGGQRDQHRDPGPIPHSGAAQRPAGGHAFPGAISSRKHHHPLQDFLPWPPEPVRVPGKQTCGSLLLPEQLLLAVQPGAFSLAQLWAQMPVLSGCQVSSGKLMSLRLSFLPRSYPADFPGLCQGRLYRESIGKAQ